MTYRPTTSNPWHIPSSGIRWWGFWEVCFTRKVVGREQRSIVFTCCLANSLRVRAADRSSHPSCSCLHVAWGRRVQNPVTYYCQWYQVRQNREVEVCPQRRTLSCVKCAAGQRLHYNVCQHLNPLSASFLDGVRNDFMLILAKPLFHQLFEIHQVKPLPIGNKKKNPSVEMFKRL